MEMPGYDATTYGERFADVYDDWYGDLTDTDACVSFLADLAGAPPARVLELGVGTGRLAVPLAARPDVVVTGLDTSPAMLDRLAAKPGGHRVTAVLGDMALVPLADPDQRFELVFVAYNTLFNLPSAEAQQQCLTRVAGLLAPGGHLVVEAFVPAGGEAGRAGTVEPRSITADRVVLSVSRHDPDRQELLGQYIDITEDGGVRLRPWHIRYATPAQLDAMAQQAGLVLAHRWAGWRHEPFHDDSPAHVSVYAPVAGAPARPGV